MIYIHANELLCISERVNISLIDRIIGSDGYTICAQLGQTFMV